MLVALVLEQTNESSHGKFQGDDNGSRERKGRAGERNAGREGGDGGWCFGGGATDVRSALKPRFWADRRYLALELVLKLPLGSGCIVHSPAYGCADSHLRNSPPSRRTDYPHRKNSLVFPTLFLSHRSAARHILNHGCLFTFVASSSRSEVKRNQAEQRLSGYGR